MLVHPQFEELMSHSVPLDMPNWWRAGDNDIYLLRGIDSMGIGSEEVHRRYYACASVLVF